MPASERQPPEEASENSCAAPDEPPEIAAEALAAAAAVPIGTLLDVRTTGLYGYRADSGRFGTAATIQALKEIGSVWAGRHTDVRIGIGDISKEGGGNFDPPHKAHKRGVEADIRPQRKDGGELPTRFDSADYSRARTQELVDVIYANAVLAVNTVFFNDSGVQGVLPLAGHSDHLHVRFQVGAAPPLLASGDEKPAVRELQRRLNRWIATSGPAGLEPLNVNGRFDDETLVAARAFQTAKGLAVDGKVGKDTWGQLPMA